MKSNITCCLQVIVFQITCHNKLSYFSLTHLLSGFVQLLIRCFVAAKVIHINSSIYIGDLHHHPQKVFVKVVDSHINSLFHFMWIMIKGIV